MKSMLPNYIFKNGYKNIYVIYLLDIIVNL